MSSVSVSDEVLATRVGSLNQEENQGKQEGKSKSRKPKVTKDQYLKDKQWWQKMKDCPEWKINMKGKASQISKTNVVKVDSNNSDSTDFSLSILSYTNISNSSECMMDTDATYHICFKWGLFMRFEKIDSGVVYKSNVTSS